jgi:hypothetical protein
VVVEEPARTQPTVDLATQLAKIPFAAGCREQDVAFYVGMAMDGGAHDLAQLLGRQAADDLMYVFRLTRGS